MSVCVFVRVVCVCKQGRSNKSRAKRGTTMGSESPDHQRVTLPRIYPSKPLMGAGRGSNHHHHHHSGAFSPPFERQRFINVVRPLSVFPDPPLPPNYTFSSSKFDNYPPSSQQHHQQQQQQQQMVRGRPPSPAPFPKTKPLRPTNFAVSGRGVNGVAVSNGAGLRNDKNLTGSALRVNLAGGSGWDLTAIRRGYAPVKGNQFQSP